MLGRMAAAPAYVQAPAGGVACLQTADDLTSAAADPDLFARYVLTVQVQTPTTPASQQFHFFTPSHRSDPWDSDDLRASSWRVQ